MKFSIATNIPVEFFGEEKGLQLLAEAGFDTVDCSLFIPGSMDKLLSDDYLTAAHHTKELLDRYGLVCNQSHAGFSFRYGMEMNTDCPEYLFSCRCIEYASIVGAKDVVVHAVRVPRDQVDFDEYNIGFYKSLEPVARKHNIRIAVENASGITTPEQINHICSELPSDVFSVCLDIGHAMVAGFDPAEFASSIIPGRLTSLHIHDNSGKSDDHALPYLGVNDWERTVDGLIKCGYNGELTMEAGKFLRPFPKELIPDALKLYCSVGKHLADMYERRK